MKDSDSPKHDPLKDAQACIVWHPADRAPAQNLINALQNKGMTLIDADDAHTAFAAAQRVSRDAKRVVIVLDTRDELHDVDRLINALERFTPRVCCWAHEPGANPPLIPLVQPVASPPPARDTAHTDHAPAPLRLVGQTSEDEPADEPPVASSARTLQPTPASTATAKPVTARDVLDADELDALLAGELGDRKH